MQRIRCLECDSAVELSIGPIRPWEAVAAEMLEQGIIIHCTKCSLHSADFSQVKCPQCGMQTLVPQLEQPKELDPIRQSRKGRIACNTCDYHISVQNSSSSLKNSIQTDSKLPLLVVLAVLFTVALTFATIELPRILSSILKSYFPDIFWEPDRIEALLNVARPIGYACLFVVIALTIAGFMTERLRLSSLGSFAFFLPAFGYFAVAMFFLAGIGILRVMWLPFWDSSPILLKLGDIAYLPLWIVQAPFRLLGDQITYRVGGFLAYLAIGTGLLIFCVGTFTWLYGKFENKPLLDFWIYKYSRHPQYLGFIIWSYGVMLLTKFTPHVRGGYQPEPSFPWMISTLIVICVALTEENTMIKQADERYLTYQESTPFMFPLPRFFSRMITAPLRMLLKKDYPKSGKEVLYTFAVYCSILILLSLLILGLDWLYTRYTGPPPPVR